MEKSQIPSVGKRSWLPYCEQTQQLKFSALIGEEITNSRWPQILKKRYTEFSTICCVASRPSAQRIILRDGIRPKRLTIFAWSLESPLRNLELSFVLFTPNTSEQVLEFGERNCECLFAKFVIPVEGDAGIVDQQFRRCHDFEDSDDDIYYWNHYFLEILDTETKSVCRILASKRCYDHLIGYDPTELGGPWYWDLTNNKHYYLNKTQGYDGHRREVIVEFLRESDVIGLSKPGPDWSVIQDIEFLFNNKKSMGNEDHVEKNRCIGGNHSTVLNKEFSHFFAWYSSLPTDKTNKLNDISGLNEPNNLRLRSISPAFNDECHNSQKDVEQV